MPLTRVAMLKFSMYNRRKKSRTAVKFLTDNNVRTALFVGTGGGTAGGGYNPNALIVERAVAQVATVLATCDLSATRHEWPHVVADGRSLPFRDGAADAILSSAVVEHVGSAVDQAQFASEHSRVARCFIMTTPNRWFPVESHTSTILKHWSPAWRARHDEFTRLLSRREFRALLPPSAKIIGKPWSAAFMALYWDGARRPSQ